MPIYVYETTDTSKPPRRFEIKQSMKDEPLRVDPETGEPVRRVISGGYGVHVPGGSTGPRLVLSAAPAARVAVVTKLSCSLGWRLTPSIPIAALMAERLSPTERIARTIIPC